MVFSLLANADHSDLTLEANDGLKIPAHLCVLKTRAPGFYRCYVKPSLSEGDLLETQANIKIPDVDGNSLRFFLRCIYTDEEVPVNLSSAAANGFSVDKDDEGEGKTHSLTRLQQSGDSQMSVHTYTLDNGTNPMTSSELSDSIHTVPEDHPNSSSALSDISDVQTEPELSGKAAEDSMMTSFAELASGGGSLQGSTVAGEDSPLDVAGSVSDKTAVSGNDISSSPDKDNTAQSISLDATYVSENFPGSQTFRRSSRDENMIGKFIRVDDMSTSVDSIYPPMPPPADKKIFPMFIEFGGNEKENSSLDWKDNNNMSTIPSPGSGGPRVSFGGGRKRWSVTSLRSIDSADLASPMSLHDNVLDRFDGSTNFGEARPGGACSKLGQDLLTMYTEGENTDVTVITSGQELKAHR